MPPTPPLPHPNLEIETEDLGDLYTESGQTLESSFAAVSKPIFAPKYAFFSINFFENYKIFALLHRSNSQKLVENFANFAEFFVIFHYFAQNQRFSHRFR